VPRTGAEGQLATPGVLVFALWWDVWCDFCNPAQDAPGRTATAIAIPAALNPSFSRRLTIPATPFRSRANGLFRARVIVRRQRRPEVSNLGREVSVHDGARFRGGGSPFRLAASRVAIRGDHSRRVNPRSRRHRRGIRRGCRPARPGRREEPCRESQKNRGATCDDRGVSRYTTRQRGHARGAPRGLWKWPLKIPSRPSRYVGECADDLSQEDL
jgi:hypothetical protein